MGRERSPARHRKSYTLFADSVLGVPASPTYADLDF